MAYINWILAGIAIAIWIGASTFGFLRLRARAREDKAKMAKLHARKVVTPPQG